MRVGLRADLLIGDRWVGVTGVGRDEQRMHPTATELREQSVQQIVQRGPRIKPDLSTRGRFVRRRVPGLGREQSKAHHSGHRQTEGDAGPAAAGIHLASVL